MKLPKIEEQLKNHVIDYGEELKDEAFSNLPR